MKRILQVCFVLPLLVWFALTSPANASLTSIPVSAPNYAFATGYDTEYEFKSVSLFVDPAATNWIAWADAFGSGSPNPYACGAGSCIGQHGFGTNDYIRMTVTNPLGSSSTVNMDWNDSAANSSGPQMILFGSAANAPDVRRYNFSTLNYYYINEAGAFNALFTTAGTYQFDFSFRNLWSSGANQAGHENVYLLADVRPVPEPETCAMLLAGLALLGFVAHRRKQSVS